MDGALTSSLVRLCWWCASEVYDANPPACATCIMLCAFTTCNKFVVKINFCAARSKTRIEQQQEEAKYRTGHRRRRHGQKHVSR